MDKGGNSETIDCLKVTDTSKGDENLVKLG